MSTDNRDLRQEDVAPVYSRISWGALFAGLFVTLTVFLLLSHLGAAIGLSVADATSGETIATGAGIWAIATALIAFFSGGCVTSRLTAGETRAEAAVYGTILWGLTFTVLLWMTGNVVRTGLTTVVGSANAAANATNPPANWERAAQQAGLTQEQMNRIRAQLPTAGETQSASAEAAWWSLAGVVVSLLAAIGGAVLSAGPRPALGGFMFRRTTVAMGHSG